MTTTTFDELERFITIYSPSEVILISPFDEATVQTIIQFTGINSPIIHKLNTSLSDNTDKKLVNCSNQKYIKQILSTFFGEETYDVCGEFYDRQMATQSFCYLLNFIQEHNPALVNKIALPVFNNTSDRMILANHTLLQLNIIGDSSNDGKKFGNLSSVSTFLNKCCSAIGRRKFQYQISNPTTNDIWLNKEYEITKFLLKDNYHLVDFFRKQLCQIRDVEKMCRQLVLKKIYPSSIFHLYNSIKLTQQMNVCLAELPDFCDYLCDDFLETSSNNEQASFNYVENIAEKIISFLETNLEIEKCKNTSSMVNFNEIIIKRGISEKLDKIIDSYENYKLNLYHIRDYLNELMQQNDGGSTDTDYIKIHETEKSGICLQMTKKRSQSLELILKNILKKNPDGILNITTEFSIQINEIKFVKASGTNVDIESPQLNDICKNMFFLSEGINVWIAKIYLDILKRLEDTFFLELQEIVQFISKIDVIQSKTYVAKMYNYCCPEIAIDSEKSFIDAFGLRHALIEHIQKNEIYVINDVILGKDDHDIINLYGTNAVGKTSLIRAIGISVIMAQAGIFVPCSKFVYKPYKSIFSRILGNDNIFKGLSTFAVEMSELRIILKMADENSLILGDELCSGTELQSALSIFVAGLIKLHEKRSSAIFATHFHEIVDYDDLKGLNRLRLKHMTVLYDYEKEALIYDRKLKDGSGPRIYGLEVCKSLYLEQDFLDLAYSIRNKNYPETRGELSHTTTVYNSGKVRGKCEMCQVNLGEEIHHLKHQKDSDENGFIGSFHKNHSANLVSVCKSCHDKFHGSETNDKQKKPSPTIRKKTTSGSYVLI
jgi:DNA mismatch repair protein MutS